MKKYLLFILSILLIPINVFAGVCEPDKLIVESIELDSTSGSAEEKSEASINGNSINLDLHMRDVGDSAEYKIVVRNASDNDFELDEDSFSLNSDHVDYTITTDDGTNVVEAKTSKDVHLKVEYKVEIPIEELIVGSYTDSNRMDVNVTSNEKETVVPEKTATPTSTPVLEPTPNHTVTPISEKDESVTVPNTFANSRSLIIVLAVVLIGVSVYSYKKNKYVTMSLLIIGTVLIMPTRSSFALCQSSISINSNIEIEAKKAMFKPGQEVNTIMKKFVSSSATYTSINSGITSVARYTDDGLLNSFTEDNIVSTDDSEYPIYMWYNSVSTTIYWYSEASIIYYNPDSSYFYANLRGINQLPNMNDISSEYVTNMSYMFSYTGYRSTTFTLDLGNKFNTSKVDNMSYLFRYAGYNSTAFTLNLGDKFDTSNVTLMQQMFEDTGYSSTVFTLDLGSIFDTSNVTNMGAMFFETGYSSPVFTLDLGDKFDTSNVTGMGFMFCSVGYTSTVFTLNLGELFDTSKVEEMRSMFAQAGKNSTVFNIELGDKFDTSKVTDMQYMFDSIGYSNPNFTLDLGPFFDTGEVTNMKYMFSNSRTLTTIYAPSSFATTKVEQSASMFSGCNNLVGGAGTVYSSGHSDSNYARLDGGESNPGYFTAR